MIIDIYYKDDNFSIDYNWEVVNEKIEYQEECDIFIGGLHFDMKFKEMPSIDSKDAFFKDLFRLLLEKDKDIEASFGQLKKQIDELEQQSKTTNNFLLWMFGHLETKSIVLDGIHTSISKSNKFIQGTYESVIKTEKTVVL